LARIIQTLQRTETLENLAQTATCIQMTSYLTSSKMPFTKTDI